jgi:hypothetical protein
MLLVISIHVVVAGANSWEKGSIRGVMEILCLLADAIHTVILETTLCASVTGPLVA